MVGSSPGGLTGRVAIVTGASRGIGRATCLALAQAGAHVVVVGRDRVRLAATAAMVVETGGGRSSALVLPLEGKFSALVGPAALAAMLTVTDWDAEPPEPEQVRV